MHMMPFSPSIPSGCFPLIDNVLKGNCEKISLALYFVNQIGVSSFSIKYGKMYLDHSDPVVVCQATALVNVPVFIKMLKDSEKMNLFSQLEFGQLPFQNRKGPRPCQ